MEGDVMNICESEIMLRRAWINQLYKEHDNICWKYKVELSKPTIEIFNNQKKLGQWISKFKTIKIDLSLIRNYSWDIVINILKHEMAHQIVDEIFKCDDKHGEVFIKACGMIGVPEEFRSASGDIPDSVKRIVEKRFDSDNAKMLEKVRKLFSLAKSPNENEALLSMKKAHELIEKHNIQRIEHGDGSRYVYEIITHKKKRIESYQRRICSILLDFYFVDIVYSYLFDPVSCQTYKTIEILGTPENVKIAQHVYFFLINQLNIMWDIHKKGVKSKNKNKRSYWLGVLKGFRKKLEKTEKDKSKNRKVEKNKTTSAVIRVQDKNFIRFKKMRFPRLTYRSNTATIDLKTYRAGVNDGKKLVIHKGIVERNGYRGKLLKQ